VNLTSAQRTRVWRRNRLLVVFFLLVWTTVTFGIAFYARELSSIDFLGWPFPYWVGAQGALIVYVLITVVFAWLMNRLDDQVLSEQEEST